MSSLSTLARLSIIFLLMLCSTWVSVRADEASSSIKGNIDSISYDSQQKTIELHGWAWDSIARQSITRLQVAINSQTFEVIPDAIARADVQKALGIPLTNTGFSADIKLPDSLSGGSYPVQVKAFFADGTSHLLPTGHGSTPYLFIDRPKDRHWILLTLVTIAIAVAYVPWLKRQTNRAGNWIEGHPLYVTATICTIFVSTVAIGITGSSWQLLSRDKDNKFVQFESSQTHIFKPKQIRSDEWSILTANVLAQWNHSPRFPVVNSHLGPEGQNMGVIGMTGVPISQPAALGRPATWGYFFLPLRQGMAWHWQLPFFACLLFLWKTLNLLRPNSSGFHLLLALTFCVAPYAAGWSLWPLYATTFPLVLFVLTASILRTNRLTLTLPLGICAGLMLTGWVLVLYPPWQVSLGSLMALMVAGWLADHRRELFWGKAQYAALALAIAVAALLLSSWWHDTAGAIAQVQATAYPGARMLQQGGDLDLFWALRGYTNLETLTFGTGPVLNPSEVSSYVLLPLPLLALGLWLGFRPTPYRWLLRSCMAFLGFWLVFRFAGIPLWLSQLTLWSYVTTTRLDLALGLVCTALLALLYGLWRPRPRALATVTAAIAITLGSAALVIAGFHLNPVGLMKANSAIYRLAIVLAVSVAAWWLMRGRVRASASMLLLLSLLATIGFNPLSLAPKSVKLSNATADMVSSAKQPSAPLRTLVFSEDNAAPMALVAAGVPVLNPVLYYPHHSFWETIGLPQQDWFEVNRYQHLRFTLGTQPDNRTFVARHRSLDSVEVTVDPNRFSFVTTGAQRVAARAHSANFLRTNPELTELGHDGGLVWFAVKGR